MLKITLEDIVIDRVDMKNKLIPVMKDDFYENFSSIEEWTKSLVKNIQSGFRALLPFTPPEQQFIRSVVSGEGIKPELLVSDGVFAGLVKTHPALLWAGSKLK